MNAISPRGRFEGVLKVVQFNPAFYVAGFSAALMGTAVLVYLPLSSLMMTLGWLVWGAAAWWLLGSLWVSHLIYDRSTLFRWTWLPEVLPPGPVKAACFVHAGFDDASRLMRQELRPERWQVLDFFDPVLLPEPSVSRARRLYPPDAEEKVIAYGQWPLEDASMDVVFLFFAAHELRLPEQRVALLREAGRVLRSDGRCVVVEHVRDMANAIAYGPGCLHFHSVPEWRRNFAAAGLKIVTHKRLTPWVRIWSLIPETV